jgi:2-hydroxy fatty acid dioxygenase
LEPVAGSVLSLILLAGAAYANTLTANHNPEASYYALSAHVFAWIAQFIGHGVFEGRAPALMDNLFQAIFLAPLFVWLECLFALGYRPELKKRVNKGVKQDVAKFRSEKALIIKGDGANGGPVTRSRATNGKAKSG